MLTQTEQIIYDLLKEGLTIKEISFRRKTTIQATYKTIRKLKELGIIKGSNYRGFNFQSTSTPGIKKIIRLHGQEFNIRLKPLSKTNNFYKQTLEYGDHKVRFYKNSIEIYLKKSFYAQNTIDCRQKSIDYMRFFLKNLQRKYRLAIEKVTQVNAHYSEIENELAKGYRKEKRKISISATEDNKTWAKIDFSFNVDEFETLHPKTSEADINKVTNYFNDIRDNYTYKPSEATQMISDLTKNQLMFNKNLVKHMKVLDDMSSTMKAIQKALKKL